MKFPLSWLKDYLDTHASAAEISARLTAIGLEVERVEDPAAALKGFVVGHVLSAEKHPDADKLKCLVVDTGREQLKVVCGAPNARAGLKGVFAPAGSVIPGSGIVLKKSLIRGQESNGMMCSEKELLVSDDHEGIIELPESVVTGAAAAEVLGLNDPVIEINLTPNRGDCAGIYGIARDLAAAGLGKLKPLDAAAVPAAFRSPVAVTLKDEKACPLFLSRLVRGVKNGPSPKWLQDRLKSAGQKPISALVDITNYFSLGFCRPLHVFDAQKLKGGLHVRLSKKGETLAALNDKTYELEDGMIAVCDDSGVLGLGGIMGGTGSAVDDKTVDVYVECAYFDAALIARTGQKLQIDSDARYRFERGVDPAFVAQGMELATKMILELCGGTASDVIVAGKAPVAARTIAYDPKKLVTLGGGVVAEARQKEILSALGFAVSSDWSVTVPSWRHDVEGAADLVEEILRIDGYDNIPVVPMMRKPGEKAPSTKTRAGDVRRALAVRGLHETVTWSFLDESRADLFGANDHQSKRALTLVNPISADLSIMRPSLLPNLIDAAARSADKGLGESALFEIGNIYRSAEAAGQVAVAAGLRFGHAERRHWSHPARIVDALDAKADALAALEACGLSSAGVQVAAADAPGHYHPGRSGALRLGPVVLAYFGEVHPAVLAALGREEAAAGFEVFLGNVPVPKKKGTQKELLRPSPFQPVGRDFAFVVDAALEADKLVRAVRGVDRKLIVDVDIFDVYTGKGVETGKKSVALGVTLQPADKTLTEEEINALSARIVEAVGKVGGVLRA